MAIAGPRTSICGRVMGVSGAERCLASLLDRVYCTKEGCDGGVGGRTDDARAHAVDSEVVF